MAFWMYKWLDYTLNKNCDSYIGFSFGFAFIYFSLFFAF